MTNEMLISILAGIPIGLYVSSVYGKRAKFSELRNEALRIIRAIDFMQEQDGVHVANDEDLKRLTLIASELIDIGCTDAANIINGIHSDIYEISMHARAGRLSAGAYEQSYSLWQNMARTMPLSKRAMWGF